MTSLLGLNHRRRHESRPLDEASLLSQAIDGDGQAFGELYERHLTAVYRYVFYRVNGNVHEAEDLTEIVFLKAWNAIHSYRANKVPFIGWLYRIAHNVVVDDHRRQPNVTLVSLDSQPSLFDDSPNPEEQMDPGSLLSLLAKLRPAHKEVLTLRFVNDLSYAEVAHIMARNEGAVRVLQLRALSALRALLEQESSP